MRELVKEPGAGGSSEQVRVERHDGAAVVRATGELDAFLAPQLESAFAQTPADQHLVVDLSRVSFIDSTALGIVTKAVRAHGAYEESTRVVLPRGSARRIFEITTLDRVLPLADSQESALAALGRSGDGRGE